LRVIEALALPSLRGVRDMEKVVAEFKIVETEDGYRIEIKGEKGKMKEIFSRLRWRKSRHHFHPSDFGFGGGFPGEMGPWCCWWEEEQEDSE
jgi:hypothetical protein